MVSDSLPPDVTGMDDYSADREDLTRASKFVAGRGGGGPIPSDIAAAYRTMVQTIADHQNAVPSPKWPPYVIGVGASLFGTGSTLLYLSKAAQPTDFVGPIVLYLAGALLIVWGLRALRSADELRRRAYFMGRMLFNVWASGVSQPHESVAALPVERELKEDRRKFQGADPSDR